MAYEIQKEKRLYGTVLSVEKGQSFYVLYNFAEKKAFIRTIETPDVLTPVVPDGWGLGKKIAGVNLKVIIPAGVEVLLVSDEKDNQYTHFPKSV